MSDCCRWPGSRVHAASAVASGLLYAADRDATSSRHSSNSSRLAMRRRPSPLENIGNFSYSATNACSPEKAGQSLPRCALQLSDSTSAGTQRRVGAEQQRCSASAGADASAWVCLHATPDASAFAGTITPGRLHAATHTAVKRPQQASTHTCIWQRKTHLPLIELVRAAVKVHLQKSARPTLRSMSRS